MAIAEEIAAAAASWGPWILRDATLESSDWVLIELGYVADGCVHNGTFNVPSALRLIQRTPDTKRAATIGRSSGSQIV